MYQITIEKNTTLEAIDAHYKNLNTCINQSIEVDLLIPSELENQYLGIVPSLYQFVATWIRYPKSKRLLLDIDNPDTTDFEKLYENELIFPVVSLVWNKKEIFNKKAIKNLRSYLRPKNVEISEKMQKTKALKGKKLLLVNFDHLPQEKLLPCFEVNGKYNDNRTQLYNYLKPAITEIIGHSQVAGISFEYVGMDLIKIINELMKNTFQWAKSNEKGAPLDPNFRGLLIKFYKKRRATFLEECKKHKGLTTYFNSAWLKETGNNELYFLEISVFDSGIGFIDKFKSHNPKDANLSDIEIIKKCLIKHMTSSVGLEKDDKGIGLDDVLSTLDRIGFLRIKTGSKCVYRNLDKNPYRNVQLVKDMELFDWNRDSNSEYTDFTNAVGSVITILYPLSHYRQ
jgi:hypothetical protein